MIISYWFDLYFVGFGKNVKCKIKLNELYHEQRRVECMYNLITLKFIFPHVQAPTNATICAIYLTNLCFLLIWMHKHEKKQKKYTRTRVYLSNSGTCKIETERNRIKPNQVKNQTKPTERNQTSKRKKTKIFVDFSGIYISSIFSFMPDFSILYI